MSEHGSKGEVWREEKKRPTDGQVTLHNLLQNQQWMH